MAQQHKLSEFHPSANAQRAGRLANRYLGEIPHADAMWQEQITNLYFEMLRIGHKMGTEGSLLVVRETVTQ